MYDINKVISIVFDALDEERGMMESCRKIRTQKGLLPDTTIWIPSLGGSDAYDLGKVCEGSDRMWSEVADICSILDIDQKRLIATVKSMYRWEKHGGLHDRYLHVEDNKDVIARLMQFLRIQDGELFYVSTERKKAWC